MTLPTESLEARIRAIENLDLDPIKVKLMNQEDGHGWTREEAEQIELLYKLFLILCLKYPEKQVVPCKKIDTFWHYHILDTLKYAEDCQNIFGYFLHHFPYFGMRGEEDKRNLDEAYSATQRLFRQEFGVDLKSPTAECRPPDDDDDDEGGPMCHGNYNPGDLRRPTLEGALS